MKEQKRLLFAKIRVKKRLCFSTCFVQLIVNFDLFSVLISSVSVVLIVLTLCDLNTVVEYSPSVYKVAKVRPKT